MPGQPNPERPLPWKAVQIGDVWDATNDAGDPVEEYSVLDYTTEGESQFIVRAANDHADLLAACEGAALALEPFAAISDAAHDALMHLRAVIAKTKGGTA